MNFSACTVGGRHNNDLAESCYANVCFQGDMIIWVGGSVNRRGLIFDVNICIVMQEMEWFG